MDSSVIYSGTERTKELVRRPLEELLKRLNEFHNVELITFLHKDNSVSNYLRRKGYDVKLLEFGDRMLSVAYTKFLDFFPEPMPAKSPGSQCWYLAQGTYTHGSYLLQFMRPMTKSSTHHHPADEYEVYHNLEGRCILNVDGKDMVLQRSSFTVNPNQVHNVRTEESFSLTLLDMVNNKHGLSTFGHVYKP